MQVLLSFSAGVSMDWDEAAAFVNETSKRASDVVRREGGGGGSKVSVKREPDVKKREGGGGGNKVSVKREPVVKREGGGGGSRVETPTQSAQLATVQRELAVKTEEEGGPKPQARAKFYENLHVLPTLLPLVDQELARRSPNNVHVKTWLGRSWLGCEDGWLGCIACRDVLKADRLRLQ